MAGKTWTNRGLKRLTIDGDLDTATLTIGAAKGSAPTVATIRDYNVVADLLGAVTEAAAANYARANVGAVTFSEDDTNDRVLIDYPASASLGTAVAAGETWTVVFCYAAGASDAVRDLIWVDVLGTPLATNGSNVVYSLADDTVTAP